MLNEKVIRVKRTIPDRWRTPEVAWNQYQEIVNQLADLQSLQIYDARTIEKIKKGIADKLKLEIPGAFHLQYEASEKLCLRHNSTTGMPASEAK